MGRYCAALVHPLMAGRWCSLAPATAAYWPLGAAQYILSLSWWPFGTLAPFMPPPPRFAEPEPGPELVAESAPASSRRQLE